jgi:hypothetical protein
MSATARVRTPKGRAAKADGPLITNKSAGLRGSPPSKRRTGAFGRWRSASASRGRSLSPTSSPGACDQAASRSRSGSHRPPHPRPTSPHRRNRSGQRAICPVQTVRRSAVSARVWLRHASTACPSTGHGWRRWASSTTHPRGRAKDECADASRSNARRGGRPTRRASSTAARPSARAGAPHRDGAQRCRRPAGAQPAVGATPSSGTSACRRTSRADACPLWAPRTPHRPAGRLSGEL